MRPRIALLDASTSDHTRRNFRRELDADLVEYDARGGDLPPDTDVDGVVVTGSTASVYWDEPWIEALVAYVGEAAAAGVPVLGVCYGHQVLATALGGQVEGMDGYELGYRTVERVGPDDAVLGGLDGEFTVFTTHGDTVTELPPGAELLARNDYGVQAFRARGCWGVQFHPEYDTDTARTVAAGKTERAGERQVERALAGITDESYAAACEVKRLFDAFVAEVRARRREDEPEDVAAD